MERVCEELRKQFPERRPQKKTELRHFKMLVRNLCDHYWHDRKVSDEKKTLKERMDERKRLLKLTADLSSTIEGLSYDNLELLKPKKFRPTGNVDGRPIYSDVEVWMVEFRGLLNHFAKTVAELHELDEEKAPIGRKSAVHMDNALRRLHAIWEELSDEPFMKNLQTAEGSDANSRQREFIAAGPRFALAIFQAIDPKITQSQVASAIEKSPVIGRKSKNKEF